MDRGSEVVRYFPDRGKFITLAIGCALLSLTCLMKLVIVGFSVAATLGAGFFLLGSINCLQSLDRTRCHIELTPVGFIERSPLRQRLVRWSEVDRFELIPLPQKYVWVGYRLAECDDPRIPRWVRRSRRRDVSLADTYGLDARELVEQLNTWRRQFRQGNATISFE
ncbi:hypothetical protein [Tautonia rosea]|uniref:hypothetical protein n=1 Tax=Tautonia rosea TaxID=2728037 RepID=UPI0014755EDD|nr:hypothetical protein [Tautonia rosea]